VSVSKRKFEPNPPSSAMHDSPKLRKKKVLDPYSAFCSDFYDFTLQVATEGAATTSSATTLYGLAPFDVDVTFDGG
jgi:hypothetical protein